MTALAVATPTYDVQARRQPRAVVALFVVEAIVAWVLAAPWGEGAAAIYGAHPDGDRALWWHPGLTELGDLHHRNAAMIHALTRATTIGLAAWFVAGLFPLGALLATLSDDEPFSLRHASARGAQLFPRMALVQLASLLACGAALVFVGAIPSAIFEAEGSLHPLRAAIVAFVPWLVALALVAFLVAVFDLARALAVRHDLRAFRALGVAFRSPRAALSLLGLSLPRWIAGLGLIGFGAAFSSASSSVLAIAIVHQLVAFSRVALRASTLARALRLSDACARD